MISLREILEFKLEANDIRRDIIEMLYRANSGHPGPSLSCVEILLTLYKSFLRFDKTDPSWRDRDRFVLSKGHAAPTLYSIISKFYDHIDRAEVMSTFRSGHFDQTGRYVDTRCQGHPDMNVLPGVELSAGSLGNGLGFACSVAEELRYRFKKENRGMPPPLVYCLIGDGEMDEGSTKEAISYAGAKSLGNLILIVDNNRQQLTGKKENVLNFGAVRDQFNEKQWTILDHYRGGEDLNGHDYQHLHWVLSEAGQLTEKPKAIIAYTIKGKGVSFMEDDAAYHGVPPKPDEYEVCMKIFDITQRIYTHRIEEMKQPLNHIATDQKFLEEKQVAPREAYGRALYHLGRQDERIIRIDADLRSSCKGDYFHTHFPERCFEAGIAETTMGLLSSAFGLEGKIPFINTFSIFYLKAMEVIRNVIAYNNLNVKIIGSHGDPRLVDGGSHAELEMLGVLRSIPNIRIVQPADGVMTYRLIFEMAREHGPIYMRFGRDKVPIIYNGKHNPQYGAGIDNSFEVQPHLGRGHLLKQGQHLTIFAIGDMVQTALIASGLLEKQGITATIIDMYSIKPLDLALVKEHLDLPILTIEPHNVIGGLGSSISEVVTQEKPQYVERIGIQDHFTKSGKPAELTQVYQLTPEHVVTRAEMLLKRLSG
ncbi:hypothetical protein JXQ70_19545 [bacterium]|nr:hypothetical protein [bacterium]